MTSQPAPTEEQMQLFAAAERVIGRRAAEVGLERSGNLFQDLKSLQEALMARSESGSGGGLPRTRSFWGWGYEEEGPDPLTLDLLLEQLKLRFGVESFDDVRVPQLEEVVVRAPRFELPEEFGSFCTREKYDRLSHSYGKSFRDVVRGVAGQYANPTDYVAYPRSEEEILSLMRFCEAKEVALVPYGGGSSVVGGVEPTASARYRGTVTLDMREFSRVLEVDEVSRAARVQAGIYGPALEDALKPYGLSPRFYPQSFEFSTLGGWIATRAGGHYCTLYTHIDDIVESVRVVTPSGVHETRRLPASGAGPSQERLWLGSEGTMGVITEAWIRLHARPRHRSSATVKFASFLDGARAVRALSQGKLYPVNCRLVSHLEAVWMGLGDGRHSMLLLGFESEEYSQREAMERALRVCEEHAGTYKASRVTHRDSGDGVRSGATGAWRRNFVKGPYLRDALVIKGLVAETFETAGTWDRFEQFHARVGEAAQRAIDTHCHGRGIITCRFTHIYPDGPAPYYSVVAHCEPGKQLETWDAIKVAVSDAIIDAGGTITHHHAVGRDHRPWYERERGKLFGTTLSGLKSTLDPQWVLNPGILLAEPEGSK